MELAVSNIQPKPFKGRGQVIPRLQDKGTEFNAVIVPGKSIRIFGRYGNHINGPREFDRTFKIGDVVEYDSYNFSYTGKIVSIGAKLITVESYDSRFRLDLNTFCWRNWDLDLDRIREERANWND